MLTKQLRGESIMTRGRRGADPARAAPAAPRGGSGTAPPAARRSRSRSRRSARPMRPSRPGGGNSACAGGGRDRLDGALQFGERELARHQLEHHRTIFEFGAQPRDRGREDAPVIVPHRLAQRGEWPPRQRGLAAVAPRLLDQAGFVQQLVAIERFLFVPGAAAAAEAEPDPLAPAERAPRLRLVGAGRPFLEHRQDDLVENVRPLLSPILPGKNRYQGSKPAPAALSAATFSGMWVSAR